MAKKAKRARKHSPCSPITCDHGTSGGKNLTTTSSLPPNFEGISTKENARELLGSEEEEKAAKRMVKEGSATKAQPKLGGGAISQCARGSDTGADCGSRLSGNNLRLTTYEVLEAKDNRLVRMVGTVEREKVGSHGQANEMNTSNVPHICHKSTDALPMNTQRRGGFFSKKLIQFTIN
ncbi:hypothetical protein Cgig2_003853 [Carnegiea gigantea]|uniref:Uncharacterized protein n=1 Tax=Carnegiea gigantea TaxID=171969 RepID=A0A9Q1JIE5_9CARY|nr:hypothetical protein Cgig2_003853 [Carnegiea gigantea]